MEKDYERDSKIFKAFCDPNRLKILDILKSGEHCACKLLEILDVSQSTLSHHMKVLIECGLVEARKCGTWNYYKISNESAKELIKFIKSITNKDMDINGNEIEQ